MHYPRMAVLASSAAEKVKCATFAEDLHHGANPQINRLITVIAFQLFQACSLIFECL